MTIRRVPSGGPTGPAQKPGQDQKPENTGEAGEFDQLMELMEKELLQQGMKIMSEEEKELKRQQSES